MAYYKHCTNPKCGHINDKDVLAAPLVEGMDDGASYESGSAGDNDHGWTMV